MALNQLVTSIPEWQALLDDLNGKIARRQKELAEADDSRPPTRSIRHKGSTESLRPNDDSPPIMMDIDAINVIVPDTNTSKSNNDTPLSTTASAQNANPMPPPTTNNTLQPPRRNISNRLKDAPAISSPVVRKRKTESLASAESGGPKHRTRSMIIVYYDSVVQNAFEDLVRHISSSRNCMRKDTMASRMASIRRMADLDTLCDGSELDVDDCPNAATTGVLKGSGLDNDLIASTSPGDADDDGVPLPALKFVSTRRMGPMREISTSKPHRVVPGGGGVRRACQAGLGAYSRRSATGSSAFDELDKGLEWCQSICERAAHQFLRDGQCSSEIEGIKLRLKEVLEKAEQETKPKCNGEETGADSELSQTTEAKAGTVKADDGSGAIAASLNSERQQPRTMKQIQIRKATEKMFEKTEKLTEKPTESPAQKSFEKYKEKSMQGVGSNSVGKGSGVISIDLSDNLDADSDVMDADDLRNEYAAIIARNSNYRRRQNVIY